MEPPLLTVVSRAYSGKRISGPPNWEVGFEGAQAWALHLGFFFGSKQPSKQPPVTSQLPWPLPSTLQ